MSPAHPVKLRACLQRLSESMTAELNIKKYHIFIEDQKQPAFGCSRDDTGVFYVKLHRLRLSIYGRKFCSHWK